MSLNMKVLEVDQVPVAAFLWQGKAQHPCSQITSGYPSRGEGRSEAGGMDPRASLEPSRGYSELSLFFLLWVVPRARRP